MTAQKFASKIATVKFIPPQLAALFALATLASLITSGGLVQAIAPEWAVLGLVTSSTVFFLLSRRKILQAIDNSDYAYYLRGY